MRGGHWDRRGAACAVLEVTDAEAEGSCVRESRGAQDFPTPWPAPSGAHTAAGSLRTRSQEKALFTFSQWNPSLFIPMASTIPWALGCGCLQAALSLLCSLCCSHQTLPAETGLPHGPGGFCPGVQAGTWCVSPPSLGCSRNRGVSLRGPRCCTVQISPSPRATPPVGTVPVSDLCYEN